MNSVSEFVLGVLYARGEWDGKVIWRIYDIESKDTQF